MNAKLQIPMSLLGCSAKGLGFRAFVEFKLGFWLRDWGFYGSGLRGLGF